MTKGTNNEHGTHKTARVSTNDGTDWAFNYRIIVKPISDSLGKSNASQVIPMLSCTLPSVSKSTHLVPKGYS